MKGELFGTLKYVAWKLLAHMNDARAVRRFTERLVENPCEENYMKLILAIRIIDVIGWPWAKTGKFDLNEPVIENNILSATARPIYWSSLTGAERDDQFVWVDINDPFRQPETDTIWDALRMDEI